MENIDYINKLTEKAAKAYQAAALAIDGTQKDLTARKKALELLKKSRRYFNILQKRLPRDPSSDVTELAGSIDDCLQGIAGLEARILTMGGKQNGHESRN